MKAAGTGAGRRWKVACAAAAAGAGLSILVFLAADWSLLKNEYHAFLLGRARTEADAAPHVRALLELARDPRASEALVDKLGARHPELTFWVFGHFVALAEQTDSAEALEVCGPRLVATLPWLRDLGGRLRRDTGFLAAWAHHLRWSRRFAWSGVLNRYPPYIIKPFGLHGFDLCPSVFISRRLEAEVEGALAAAGSPLEGFEAFVRLWDASLAAKWWTQGATALPVLDLRNPSSEALTEEALRLHDFDVEMVMWFSENLAAFRFDPKSGRFEEAAPGAGNLLALKEADIAPAAPLPGWEGEVPRVSAVAITPRGAGRLAPIPAGAQVRTRFVRGGASEE